MKAGPATDRNGVAVHAEPEWRDDRYLDVAKLEAGCDRDRRDQVSGIVQADVPACRVHVLHHDPARTRLMLKLFLGGAEALVHCDQQRCGIRERDKADAQLFSVTRTPPPR